MIGVVTYEVVVLPILLFQYGWVPLLLDQLSDATPGVTRFCSTASLSSRSSTVLHQTWRSRPFLAWEFNNELHSLYYGVERLPNSPVPPRERTAHIAAALRA